MPKNILSQKQIKFKNHIDFFFKNDTIDSEYCKGGRSMAYKISDDCISCGACAAECPVGAISEGDGKYEINADACVSCGACADTCPVGAPSEE